MGFLTASRIKFTEKKVYKTKFLLIKIFFSFYSLYLAFNFNVTKNQII